MPESDRPIVLVVDDSTEEILLLQSAFEAAGHGDRLRAVNNGEQALNYIEGKAEFADRRGFPPPCLILLDIKMPVMDGFDILTKIRANSRFQDLPVCMYSNSSQEADMERAVRLGADCYIEKPNAFSAQVDLARSIADTCFRQPPLHGRPRILLRKRRHPANGALAGLYLQPDGTWHESRETARQFPHTVEAHWWAKEQDYLKAEVVLTYPDPGRDYAILKP